MTLLDFCHPDKVPPLGLPLENRSREFYLLLTELPDNHPYFSPEWVVFPDQALMEGASAWTQAGLLSQRVKAIARAQGADIDDFRVIVGCDDPPFDEALGYCLRMLGLNVRIAEVHLKKPEN